MRAFFAQFNKFLVLFNYYVYVLVSQRVPNHSVLDSTRLPYGSVLSRVKGGAEKNVCLCSWSERNRDETSEPKLKRFYNRTKRTLKRTTVIILTWTVNGYDGYRDKIVNRKRHSKKKKRNAFFEWSQELSTAIVLLQKIKFDCLHA